MNAWEVLMHPCESLRISYEPCDSLTNNLPNLLRMLQILKNAFTNVKNACECLKNETNTKCVLADFVSLILFASIHRVKLFYFVFVWKRQLSLACPGDEKRDNGKPDRRPSHLLITKLFLVSNICRRNATFVKCVFFYFKRFLFATVYINQLHNFRSLNSTQNFKLTKKLYYIKGKCQNGAYKSLKTSCDHYKCIAINKNGLQMHCHQ